MMARVVESHPSQGGISMVVVSEITSDMEVKILTKLLRQYCTPLREN